MTGPLPEMPNPTTNTSSLYPYILRSRKRIGQDHDLRRVAKSHQCDSFHDNIPLDPPPSPGYLSRPWTGPISKGVCGMVPMSWVRKSRRPTVLNLTAANRRFNLYGRDVVILRSSSSLKKRTDGFEYERCRPWQWSVPSPQLSHHSEPSE